MSDAVRIGNFSAYYGDRLTALREMLEGGPIDVLTGDYLAELTMLILGRDRMKDPSRGYARTFLRQLEECLGLAVEKRVKIVANAGGLNPAGLAEALRKLATKVGVTAKIAHVEGDDLVARASELGFGPVLTANAYLGGWGIAECLREGADIVVTGRVTDASLVVGAAAAHFGWKRDDWDALAGATAAGHVIECGTQATGGNYSFFYEHDVRETAFPIAEISADGSSIITKHAGTGGVVSAGTVKAQLFYEITGARYAGPDVTTRIDTVELEDLGDDRVRMTGTRGEPPPPTLKVCLNTMGGHRNEVVFLITGLDIEKKAELVREQMTARLRKNPPKEMRFLLARVDREDADTEQGATALLRLVVKDPNPEVVGRAVSSAAVELATASYPGFSLTAPPGEGSPYGVYRPAYVDASLVPHVAILSDGTRRSIAASATTRALEPLIDSTPLASFAARGPTRRAPLGLVAGARSGDKGGTANLGLWARHDAAWPWLAEALTIDALRKLLPETASFPTERHLFPKLRGMNFVIDGLLGEGVASSTRFDPQAKGLGEWLRARYMEIPVELLPPG